MLAFLAEQLAINSSCRGSLLVLQSSGDLRHGCALLLSTLIALWLGGSPALAADDAARDHGTAREAAERPSKMTVRSGHRLRDYYLFVPASLAPDTPAPLLLLLHGSYSTPLDMLPQWVDVAQREGIILVAPKSFADYGWRIFDDSPALMRDVIDDVAARRPIDRRRLYLFGHSGGAVHALTLAMLESQYFAAVAIHAGAWRQRESFNAIPAAKRKIPVWIALGDQDQYFRIADAQATEAALRAAGFPVTLRIIRHHDHSYEAVAPEVNRAAWEFLAAARLDETPVFRSYR